MNYQVMRNYEVVIENHGECISSFEIIAPNKKKALAIAASHRRLQRIKGKVIVFCMAND